MSVRKGVVRLGNNMFTMEKRLIPVKLQLNYLRQYAKIVCLGFFLVWNRIISLWVLNYNKPLQVYYVKLKLLNCLCS